MSQYPSAPAHPRIKPLALCVALAIPAMVQAQQAGTTVVLPEVKVQANALGETTEGTGSYTTGKSKTSTPLSMSLRDTPQSVSVVTQQRIEDQGLLTITDVINNVTGVSLNRYETHRGQIAARGFKVNNIMIDGAPTSWEQPWSSGEIFSSLAMYDRVEVVRGATGLMTGAGEPSAALNLVRKRASSKELTGTVEFGIGSWNQRRAMADVSTAVNEAKTLRARVVGEYTGGDNWADLLKNKSQTFFATVEADLTPNTILALGIGRQETDPKGPMWGGLPAFYADGSKTNWDRSKTTSADWTRWNTVYENYYANLEHRFDNDWKIKATYSRGNRTADSYLLYLSGYPDRVTGLGMGAFAGSYFVTTRQDDIGLHASGPFQLAGRQHEMAVGYLYSKQNFNSDSRAADFGAGGTPAVGNFNDWDGTDYANPSWGDRTFYETASTKMQSMYAVARFSITDPLKVVVGARLTDYKKTGYGAWTPAYEMKYDQEITPYAGLVYDINSTYSIYGSYTDIFQPQNYKDLSGNMLDPVKGKASEVGVKGEFFDGRLNASFALFHIKQDNLGQEVGLVDRDGAGPLAPETYYRGAKGAKSDGFEFDLSGELARGWNASAGYSQFDARDADGNDVNGVYPRKLLRVFTTYRLPGEWNAVTIGGGANWEGRTRIVDAGAPGGAAEVVQKDYVLVNLMARYDFSKQLSGQLNINNLLDEKYYGMFAAYGAITYGAPRNVTATLRYKF